MLQHLFYMTMTRKSDKRFTEASTKVSDAPSPPCSLVTRHDQMTERNINRLAGSKHYSLTLCYPGFLSFVLGPSWALHTVNSIKNVGLSLSDTFIGADIFILSLNHVRIRPNYVFSFLFHSLFKKTTSLGYLEIKCAATYILKQINYV